MILLIDVFFFNIGKIVLGIIWGLWVVFIYSYLIVIVEVGEEVV